MKLLLIYSALFISFLSLAQNPTRIKFSYDDAGNQTKREICINCPSSKQSSTLTTEDFIQEDKISYYPNPVREELYINWKNKENNIVNTIELYNLGGQLLKTYSDLKTFETATINLQSYPEGLYEVVLFFENTTKQTLKIVKK